MTIDFNKLIEFNNKHPDNTIFILEFIFLNMAVSDDVPDEYVEAIIAESEWDISKFYKQLELSGLAKITGEGIRDISIRDLGLELIGQSKSDSIMELAEQIRDLFPKGVKSGGKLVRSSSADIAEKLRKFFKKHKYSQEQVLEATKRYVNSFRQKNFVFMQAAVYFIEKDGVSSLAAECDGVRETIESNEPTFIDNTDRL